MRILYVGDIMGKPGRKVVEHVLPSLKKDKKIDLVVAQSENVTHGKGMTPQHMRELQEAGIDVFSGGNHTVEREELDSILNDENEPVIRPANMKDLPGRGYHVFDIGEQKVLVVSILGETFPKSYYDGHPLETIDKIIEAHEKISIRVVNFHGDFSSQKRIIGYYLDGRASVVVGDHWHVPSADAMILPKGTAHISDVGMCGTVHTSLGIDMQGAINRWKDPESKRADIVDVPPYQFNAILVDVGEKGLAKKIEQINLILEDI